MPKADDWEAQCAALFERYAPLQGFFDTWGPTSGGKKAFRGQLCAMLVEILGIDGDDAAGRATKPLEVLQALCSTIEEDFLLALRFNYYVRARSLVPDAMYDAAERDFLERPEIEDSPLMNPGSDNPDDYPVHVKAFAMYLATKRWHLAQEPAPAPPAPSTTKPKPKPAKNILPFAGDLFPEV